jgi:hypothetical protein
VLFSNPKLISIQNSLTLQFKFREVKLKKTIIIVLFFFAGVLLPQRNNFFSYGNRLAFANHLYCEGDYLRAFDEYRELLKTTANDTLRLWAGMSLRNLRRYNEAEDYFKGLFYFSTLEDESRCEFFKTKFIRKNYSYFFTDYQEEYPAKYKREILKLKYFSLFYLPWKETPDSTKLVELYDYDEAKNIAQFYYQKKNLPRKDPTTAALLSVFIPGSGKIYTENYSDGITAFVSSVLFYGLSAWKFKNGKNLSGALFAGVGLFFHAGSVYGSAVSAKLFNEQKELEFQKSLTDFAIKVNYFLPDFSPKCK